jgi:prophage regulatory protein
MHANKHQPQKPATILRMDEVLTRVGISKSQIYNMISDGEFPRQVRLSARTVGFYEAEIDEWIASRQRVGCCNAR